MRVEISSGLDYDNREKLPSLKQYLKSIGKKKLSPAFVVSKIWKPGTWPNYTFETESFRVRINKGSAIYRSLEATLEDLIGDECCLAIRVDDRDRGVFTIISLDNERTSWAPLGDSGYSGAVRNKK